MKRTLKVISLVFILVVLMMSFMACTLEYGTPDKLDIGGASFGERILIGLQVAAMGIGVVFVVLALLIGMIILFKYAFKLADLIKAKLPKKAAQAPAQVESKPQIEGLENEDEEIAAVISAAIMAYYEENKQVYTSNLKFRVRSINEIKN